MYSSLLSITINDIDIKCIQQLNKRLEFVIDHTKSLNQNITSSNHLLTQIRLYVIERHGLRNNYYRRKFPLILQDLSVVKARKKHLQWSEKQHYQSAQFYKKVFNIQSSSNIEQYQQQLHQSIQFLNELKTNVHQRDKEIDRLKEELIQQNTQINCYSGQLFQIHYEQDQLRSDIRQLKEQIRFENQFYYEQKYVWDSADEIYTQQNDNIILNRNGSSTETMHGNQLDQYLNEYIHLSTQISQINVDIEQKSIDLLSLQSNVHSYRPIFTIHENNFIQSFSQPLLVPTITKSEEISQPSTSLINEFNENRRHSQQQQLPIETNSKTEWTKVKSKKKSLGPNLQSRLEALEAAMGVRLNLAKRQGRHSLSNTTSPSPMQLSPTSITMNTTQSNSLTLSSRHNMPVRSGQGIQRSASSCDVENRPGPIKRLKPTLPNENCPSSSIAASIATVKKYPPPVRRPTIPTTQTKQVSPIKQHSSPMDTSSPRLSRSSTTSTTSSSNSSNYRTPIGSISPKIFTSPSPKRIINNVSPHAPKILPHKQRLSIFGEQFSDDILKRNLLWIDFKEFDAESRSEIILQFGSIETFLSEQKLFFTKQQQDLKLAAKNKTIGHRSRFHSLIPKKDRLELL